MSPNIPHVRHFIMHATASLCATVLCDAIELKTLEWAGLFPAAMLRCPRRRPSPVASTSRPPDTEADRLQTHNGGPGADGGRGGAAQNGPKAAVGRPRQGARQRAVALQVLQPDEQGQRCAEAPCSISTAGGCCMLAISGILHNKPQQPPGRLMPGSCCEMEASQSSDKISKHSQNQMQEAVTASCSSCLAQVTGNLTRRRCRWGTRWWWTSCSSIPNPHVRPRAAARVLPTPEPPAGRSVPQLTAVRTDSSAWGSSRTSAKANCDVPAMVCSECQPNTVLKQASCSMIGDNVHLTGDEDGSEAPTTANKRATKPKLQPVQVCDFAVIALLPGCVTVMRMLC